MEKIKELYTKYKEIINYLIVGVLTTVVSLAVYYISVCTFLNPENGVQLQIANILSWIAGVTFAYFTNRKYVFESKDLYGFETNAIVTMKDVVEHLYNKPCNGEIVIDDKIKAAIDAYYEQYGAK